MEGAVWLPDSSWHDAPQSDKVPLPDLVGHTHTHSHTICYRRTCSAGARHLFHMTQRQKHIQRPYVANMHDRATCDRHELIRPLNQRERIYLDLKHAKY